MSNALKILAVLLGGICLAIVIFVVLLHLTVNSFLRDIRNLFDNTEAAEAPVEIATVQRIRFLSGVDFDAGPVRLVLESSLTGGDALLIDNQQLLRQMSAQASIPDLGVGGRATLLGMIFTGGKLADRVPALRLYQGGYLQAEEYCLPQACGDDETRQSLQQLIAGASGRVVSHHDIFKDHAAYAAAFARAKSASGRLTDLSRQPVPASATPISFSLSLPPVALPLADPLPPDAARDLADYEDALSAAINARLPDIAIYVQAVPQARGTTVFNGCEGQTRQLAVLDDTHIATVTATGDTDAQGYARVAAITDWSFLPLRPMPPLPDTLQSRLDTGALAPECLRIWTPEGPALIPAITVSPPRPMQYDLQWEEVLPLRDDDESAVLE